MNDVGIIANNSIVPSAETTATGTVASRLAFDEFLRAASDGNVDTIDSILLQIGERILQQATDINGNKALHLASSSGCVEIMKRLVNSSTLYIQGENQFTPFLSACKAGQLAAIAYLLTAGVDPTKAASNGWTGLMVCCKNERLEAARIIVNAVRTAGGDVNALLDFSHPRSNGFTALHLATKRQSEDVVRFLVESGASINKRSAAGDSALLLAVHEMNLEITKMLLDGGADVDIFLESKASGSRVGVLGVALSNPSRSNPKMVQLLLQRGVKVLVWSGAQQKTPIDAAIDRGNWDLALLLADSVLVMHDNGSSSNSSSSCGGSGIDSVRPSASSSEGVKWGGRSCANAAAACHWALLRLLVEKGADPNGREEVDGFTPLMCAVKHSNLQIVKLLVTAGASVNESASSGETAMHMACKFGFYDAVTFLGTNGAKASLTMATRARDVPLMLAAAHNRWNVVKHLVEALEADTETCCQTDGQKGWTVLMLAATKADAAVVQMLLDAGARVDASANYTDPQTGAKKQITPLELAQSRSSVHSVLSRAMAALTLPAAPSSSNASTISKLPSTLQTDPNQPKHPMAHYCSKYDRMPAPSNPQLQNESLKLELDQQQERERLIDLEDRKRRTASQQAEAAKEQEEAESKRLIKARCGKEIREDCQTKKFKRIQKKQEKKRLTADSGSVQGSGVENSDGKEWEEEEFGFGAWASRPASFSSDEDDDDDELVATGVQRSQEFVEHPSAHNKAALRQEGQEKKARCVDDGDVPNYWGTWLCTANASFHAPWWVGGGLDNFWNRAYAACAVEGGASFVRDGDPVKVEHLNEWDRLRHRPFDYAVFNGMMIRYMDDSMERECQLPNGGIICNRRRPPPISKHPAIAERAKYYRERAAAIRQADLVSTLNRKLYVLLLMYEHALTKSTLSDTLVPKELRGLGATSAEEYRPDGDDNDTSSDADSESDFVQETFDITAPEREVVEILLDDDGEGMGEGMGLGGTSVSSAQQPLLLPSASTNKRFRESYDHGSCDENDDLNPWGRRVKTEK